VQFRAALIKGNILLSQGDLDHARSTFFCESIDRFIARKYIASRKFSSVWEGMRATKSKSISSKTTQSAPLQEWLGAKDFPLAFRNISGIENIIYSNLNSKKL